MRLEALMWRIVVSVVISLGVMLPVAVRAQDAVLTGTVTDATGGLLRGTSVTAVHAASGNVFEGVTDARGIYQIPVRTGIYHVTAQLEGFSPATRNGLEVLVGQQVQLNLQLNPASLQETVVVTGAAPLVEATQSQNASNIDPRQLSDLPINGRNWLDLTM